MRAFDLKLGKILFIGLILNMPLMILSQNGLWPSEAFWNYFIWPFIIWMLLCLYFVFKLLISTELRDEILTKLFYMQERDEREAYVVREASRFSVLSTMALVLVFLFLSTFTFSLTKNLDPNAYKGKQGSLTMGWKFSPLKTETKFSENKDGFKEIITYNGLPISDQFAFLILILWPILNYQIYVRRLLRRI